AKIVEWPEDSETQRSIVGQAAALIHAGEVVAFPTDTVYGIGVHAWNQEAVNRLYQIKQRPANKAIALLLAGPEQASEVTGKVTPALAELAAVYWPGPLTLIVPWSPSVEEGARQPFATVGI